MPENKRKKKKRRRTNRSSKQKKVKLYIFFINRRCNLQFVEGTLKRYKGGEGAC